jgi:2-oxoglutarate ferredoxin oxidoreductase subunit gamma
MKKIEVRISGLGGQGVVLAGQILGRATVYSGRNAVQTQSYGAEARGSAAKSEVIISDDKIGFSAVRKCDILIAMSQEAVEKNIKDLKEDSILLVDSSIAKKVPATEIAEKIFKAKICVNMIMLGALANITKIANEKSFTRAIKETVSTEAINVNLRAYRKGLALTL